jgi:hypothetical protein
MRTVATGLADQHTVGGPRARAAAAAISRALWAVDETPRVSRWQTPLGRVLASACPATGASERERHNLLEEGEGMVGAPRVAAMGGWPAGPQAGSHESLDARSTSGAEGRGVSGTETCEARDVA